MARVRGRAVSNVAGCCVLFRLARQDDAFPDQLAVVCKSSQKGKSQEDADDNRQKRN